MSLNAARAAVWTILSDIRHGGREFHGESGKDPASGSSFRARGVSHRRTVAGRARGVKRKTGRSEASLARAQARPRQPAERRGPRTRRPRIRTVPGTGPQSYSPRPCNRNADSNRPSWPGIRGNACGRGGARTTRRPWGRRSPKACAIAWISLLHESG